MGGSQHVDGAIDKQSKLLVSTKPPFPAGENPRLVIQSQQGEGTSSVFSSSVQMSTCSSALSSSVMGDSRGESNSSRNESNLQSDLLTVGVSPEQTGHVRYELSL